MTQRTERIDELLRQEIGQALEREVTDPRIGFVTVTDVETAPDLSRARVWVSVIGTPEERKATLHALRGAMPFIRHGLGSKIRLRRIPELDVRLDDSVERGSRVLRIINDLEAGRLPDDPASLSDTLPTPLARLPHEGDAAEEPDVVGPESGNAPDSTQRTGAASKRSRKRSGTGDGRGADEPRTRRPRSAQAARRRPR